MDKLLKYISKKKVLVFTILAIISLLFCIIMIGISIGFWIVLILWIIFFLLFFVRPAVAALNIYIIAITIILVLSMLISFRVIFSDSTSVASGEKSPEGVLIEDCTSTINDQPQSFDNWKASVYSAPLEDKSSDGSKYANNVRTFSYSAIKNKTSDSDIYARIEKTDGSYISGAITTMEACDANNKATKYYTTSNNDSAAGENVVASIHYFHGGSYLHGVGDYRVDVYVKPAGGSWHLINRMTGIKITE
jgi:hypothetical protein